jgi:N-acetylglucosaminyl-diphospho-decaprenol L-rhamnosyltransferase
MADQVPDLAIIIVTWNVCNLVLDALRTVNAELETSRLRAEIIVVDNASSDGTAEAVRAAFPVVKVLVQDHNLGFAAANNVAMRTLGFKDQPAPNPGGPPAVLLLNPDTLVQPGALRILFDELLLKPQTGAVGAQLAYGDGSFQHGAFSFPGLWQIAIDLFPLPSRLYDSRLNGRYDRTLYADGEPFAVDHPLGAAFMLRRETIEQIGLLDEQFFMYCEEVDWSLRIRRAGWEIMMVPSARITHLEAKSSSQARPQSVINLWTSRLRLYQKHYPPFKLALAKILVRLGIRRRLALTQRDTKLKDAQRRALVSAYKDVISLFS